MMKVSSIALSAVIALGSAFAAAQDRPFGGEDDVAFAEQLWKALQDEELVGPDRIHVRPFEGNEPHGSIQQVLKTSISLDDRNAEVIVKVNHGGPDVSVLSVYRQPNENLGAYTVMFKREEGYDPENQNWFWAKYTKDGSLDKNPNGISLAGRVAKGADQGCIACHSSLGGADREILNDR